MESKLDAKLKVVLCHGCFDVIHMGHIKYLEAAKKHGDYLIVTLTSDRFVNKGPGRPYFSEQQRKQMLEAIAIVDEVHIIDGPTALPALERFRPDFYVKGSDYRDFTKDATGEIENEKEAVEAYGGKLAFTDEETFSSSTLINKFFAPWTDQQKKIIEAVNASGGIEYIRHLLEKVSPLKVFLVGEPILDIYRFCNPEGISSKSPTISARFQYEEKYYGGSWAIENHLKDFCKVIRADSCIGPVPKKIRYISTSNQQRIFEVTEIDELKWKKEIQIPKESDMLLVADFGHGLCEGEVLNQIEDHGYGFNEFKAINVQSNSSNFGFNVFQKYYSWTYLCLDVREARLALHDRFSPPIDMLKRIEGPNVGLTLGPNGAYLEQKGALHHSPAFSDKVVDATGAGDAYFALTSVLLKAECKAEIIPFLGNVFAGLKTKIIGNKTSVTKAQLLKACEGILK